MTTHKNKSIQIASQLSTVNVSEDDCQVVTVFVR